MIFFSSFGNGNIKKALFELERTVETAEIKLIENMDSVDFDQTNMVIRNKKITQRRDYVHACINKKKIKVVKEKAIKCVKCRKLINDTLDISILCDRCNGWSHLDCINTPFDFDIETDDFFCCDISKITVAIILFKY